MIRYMQNRYLVAFLALTTSCCLMSRALADVEVSEVSFDLGQATQGRLVYLEQCANCHGVELAGNEAGPALIGASFLARWTERPVGELFDLTTSSMPVSTPVDCQNQRMNQYWPTFCIPMVMRRALRR